MLIMCFAERFRSVRTTTEKPNLIKRLGWFALLYAASFAVVASVAVVLRLAIRS